MNALYVMVVAVLALMAAGTSVATTSGSKQHIVLMSIPCYGHFMPLKAVAEELLLDGHDVTLVVEEHLTGWCHTAIDDKTKAFGCRTVPSSGMFGPELFTNMSKHDDLGSSFTPIFEEMWRHHEMFLSTFIETATVIHQEKPISLILTDLSTLVGFGVAHKLDVPYVSMFPLTLHMPLGPATHLPSIGTAFPKDGGMSFTQRATNWLIKMVTQLVGPSMIAKLNDVRAKHGIRPLHTQAEVAGMKSLILTPAIWGLDIPQPICPNIVPLGVLSPRHDFAAMEGELTELLDGDFCRQRGAIYVNFGTLAVLSDRTFQNVWEGIAQLPYCVVWKIREADRMAAINKIIETSDDKDLGRRFFIRQRFATPVAIMNHPTIRGFVTHCGDTSVLESIEAVLPVAGIPIFADQGDVCMRVNESGIGRYVGHKNQFTPQDLVKTLGDIVGTDVATPRDAETPTDNAYVRRMRTIRTISRDLGGPARGAKIIIEHLEKGLLVGDSQLSKRGGFEDMPLTQCQTLYKAYLEQGEGHAWRLGILDMFVGEVLFFVMVILGALRLFNRLVFGKTNADKKQKKD